MSGQIPSVIPFQNHNLELIKIMMGISGMVGMSGMSGMTEMLRMLRMYLGQAQADFNDDGFFRSGGMLEIPGMSGILIYTHNINFVVLNH